MLNKQIKLMLVLVVLSVSTMLIAQPTPTGNFYQDVQAFEQWKKKHSEPQHRNKERKDGIQEKFERWKWYTAPRVYPTGKYPESVDITPSSSRNKNRQFAQNPGGNWQQVSPLAPPKFTTPEYDPFLYGNGRVNCITFDPSGFANNLWVGTSSGGIFKSNDAGKSWVNINNSIPLPLITAIAVDPYNPFMVYAATGDFDNLGFNYGRENGVGLFKTTDGGSNWYRVEGNFFDKKEAPSTYLTKVFVHQRRNGEVIVSGAGGIHKSKDSGATWSRMLVASAIVMQQASSNPDLLYATTINRKNRTLEIMKSLDFGDTWTKLDRSFLRSEFDNGKIAIAPTDPNTVYLLGTNPNTGGFSALMRTNDGGKTWEKRTDKTKINILGWSLGDSLDLGGQDAYNLSIAVDPTNKDRVFVGGIQIWGSDDGGSNFYLVNEASGFWGISPHVDVHDIRFHPKTGEFFAATDGGLHKTSAIGTTDMNAVYKCHEYVRDTTTGDFQYRYVIPGCYQMPTQWTDLTAGIVNTEFYGIGLSKNNTNMVLGGCQDNGTYCYNNGKWAALIGGDGMAPLIHHDNANVSYAQMQYGTMFKTTDGWKEDFAFVSPKGDEGDWFTPVDMSNQNPDVIISGRTEVWRTNDGAKTWQKLTNFYEQKDSAKIHAIAFAPSDDKYIYAAKGVYYPTNDTLANLIRTADGGKTWEDIGKNLPLAYVFPTDIAVHATNPNIVWVTFSGYINGLKVAMTQDGGKTWRNVSKGLPNVPANTIVHQAGSAANNLYIGTDLGVYYRDNNWNEWIPYNDQLPAIFINDLKIQEREGKLYAGTWGRGIWKSDLIDGALVAAKSMTKISDKINIYPNPATSSALNIEWYDSTSPLKSLEIFDTVGRRLVWRENITNQEIIDIQGFTNGLYFIKLTTDNESVTKKLIIQR